jgi:hypothetical protein
MRQDLSRRVLFIHLKKAKKGTGLFIYAPPAGQLSYSVASVRTS